MLTEEDGRQRFVYEPYRLEEAYGSEGYFPGGLVELQDGGYLRGLRVARVVIHPAQANPVGRQLRLYTRIRFRLAYGAPLVSQGVRRPSDQDPESYARILAEHIVNYEAVKDALEAAGLKPEVAEVTMRAENTIELAGEDRSTLTFRQVRFDDYLKAARPAPSNDAAGPKVGVIVAQGVILEGLQPAGKIGGASLAPLIRQARQDERGSRAKNQ